MKTQISEELKRRAAAVGYTVNDTRAGDGTYWIPSASHWRSIEQIEVEVAERESRTAN